MRFHIGKPPATPDFSPQVGGEWTPLKEPSPWVLNIIATPIGIGTAILLAAAWGETGIIVEGNSSPFGLWTPIVVAVVVFGIGFPLLILVHELIHALGYEKYGTTDSTTIVFWPSKLLFCAITFNAYRRNRMLLVYVLPFLVLSVLPLVICKIFGVQSWLLMLISVVNGLFCCGDIFCFFLILIQVPQNAVLQNQGWSTWWRAGTAAA